MFFGNPFLCSVFMLLWAQPKRHSFKIQLTFLNNIFMLYVFAEWNANFKNIYKKNNNNINHKLLSKHFVGLTYLGLFFLIIFLCL